MAVNKHLDPGTMSLRSIVDEIFPEHIRSDNPKLVSALKLYADYLERDHRSAYFLNRVQDQRDIDTIAEEFFLQLQKEIGAPIPQTFAADRRLFYKQIKDLYISRGTKDSIFSFFRLLFDDSVEIHFPNEDLFAPSDGKWYDQRAKIIEDRTKFSPAFTYTTTEPTFIIQGQDNNGSLLNIDNPVIFVRGIYRDDYKIETVLNQEQARLEYRIVFDNEINGERDVEIYSEGIFTNQDGFASDLKILQDSFFYQKFSYVLRTGTDINLWKSAFNRLVHPAGFIFFGEIVLFLEAISQIPQPPGFQTGGDPIPITIPVTKGKGFAVQGIERELEMHLKDNKSAFGAGQYLDQIKFALPTQLNAFEEYTIEEAINSTINIKIGSEITIS